LTCTHVEDKELAKRLERLLAAELHVRKTIIAKGSSQALLILLLHDVVLQA
jgi:hypothetical protein